MLVKFFFHWDWIDAWRDVYFRNLPNTPFVWQHVKWPNTNISICQSPTMPVQNEVLRNNNKSEIVFKKLIIMIAILVLKILVDPFEKSGIKGQEP